MGGKLCPVKHLICTQKSYGFDAHILHMKLYRKIGDNYVFEQDITPEEFEENPELYSHLYIHDDDLDKINLEN